MLHFFCFIRPIDCKMMEGKLWLCVKGGLNALYVDLDFSHIPFMIRKKQESTRGKAQLGDRGRYWLSYLNYSSQPLRCDQTCVLLNHQSPSLLSLPS